jgi:hypothetical protein
MLELIKNLQDRVTKLEAAQATAENKEQVPPKSPAGPSAAASSNADNVSQATNPSPTDPEKKQDQEDKRWGRYTPNLGYQLVDTEYGDVNLSIYTYARYLNQLGIDGSYTGRIWKRQDSPAASGYPTN